jgi:ATP-dependent RNA helicase DDX35
LGWKIKMSGSGGFWKPAATTLREESRSHEEAAAPFNFSRAPLAQQRMLLPIYKHKRQILYAMENHGVIVIVGETGCGKSTQIPQYLYENGWCDNDFQVVCTQPRRIAAQTLAQRVSQEVGRGAVGATVGYTVRFDDKSSQSTKIKFVTDGMLLREATLTDPLLSKYSVVMVDEAHERNLNSDAILGLLKKIRRKRKDLRIIVCSATIDAQAFLNFFVKINSTTGAQPGKRKRRWGPAKGETEEKKEEDLLTNNGTIISVDGRQHSVDILYLDKPTSSYIRSMVDAALKICDDSKGGDVLCFLPSGEEVDEAIRMAQDQVDTENNHDKVMFLPLYGALPYNMQARVFQSTEELQGKGRRVIFATNIAETSVTVPRITHVIDSGLVKLPYFDPKTDFERLIVVPVSQASAQQRAGRAGRLHSGQCYRLFTEKFMLEKMDRATPPEILRTNLTSFILTLKALGVDNILAFDMMDLPGVDALSHGLESLYALGAIDDKTNLTTLGLDMSAFPTEPRVSRMLLESLKEGCAWEVLGVASALQVRSLFVPPRGPASRRQQQQHDYEEAISQVADSSGDLVTYANVIAEQDDRDLDQEECKERFINYIALRRVMEVRNQLARFLRKYGRVRDLGMTTGEERSKAIRRCVTAGFFFNVAKLGNDGRYYTIRGKQNILVTPNKSSMFHSHGTHSEYIVFCETHDGARGGIELRSVSSIDARWLRELAPHYWD